MKKILAFILLFVAFKASAQVIVSQPQQFNKWVVMQDTLKLNGAKSGTPIPTKFLALDSKNNVILTTSSGGGGITSFPLILGYGFIGQPLSFNGSSSINGILDTTKVSTHWYLQQYYLPISNPIFSGTLLGPTITATTALNLNYLSGNAGFVKINNSGGVTSVDTSTYFRLYSTTPQTVSGIFPTATANKHGVEIIQNVSVNGTNLTGAGLYVHNTGTATGSGSVIRDILADKGGIESRGVIAADSELRVHIVKINFDTINHPHIFLFKDSANREVYRIYNKSDNLLYGITTDMAGVTGGVELGGILRLPNVATGTAANGAYFDSNGTLIKGVTPAAPGSAVWGLITGTLSDQTDLQNALNAKVPFDVGNGISLTPINNTYGLNVGLASGGFNGFYGAGNMILTDGTTGLKFDVSEGGIETRNPSGILVTNIDWQGGAGNFINVTGAWPWRFNSGSQTVSESIIGTAGAGVTDYIAQSSTPTTPSSGHQIVFADGNARITFMGSNGFGMGFSKSMYTVSHVNNWPDANLIVVGRSDTATLTNKTINPRVDALSSNSGTYSVSTDSYDYIHVTAQTATITNLTVTGSPADGRSLHISITGTASVPFTLDATKFESSGSLTLPTTTNSTTGLDFGFTYNTETSKWRLAYVF